MDTLDLFLGVRHHVRRAHREERLFKGFRLSDLQLRHRPTETYAGREQCPSLSFTRASTITFGILFSDNEGNVE